MTTTNLPATAQPAGASPPKLAVLPSNNPTAGLPANWWIDDSGWQAVERLCTRLADSSMVPAEFQGKAANVFVALMSGLPLGLSPLACLQSICVINGRPTLFGDAPIAQVLAHPSLVEVAEVATGTIKDGTRQWSFKVTRRLQSGSLHVVERTFSVADARTARLWEKAGPWSTSPDRMIYNRARAFALRDAFADVLKGVSIAADPYEEPSEFGPRIGVEQQGASVATVVTESAGVAEQPAPAKKPRKKADAPAEAKPPAPTKAAEPDDDDDVPGFHGMDGSESDKPGLPAGVSAIPIVDDLPVWFGNELGTPTRNGTLLWNGDAERDVMQWNGGTWLVFADQVAGRGFAVKRLRLLITQAFKAKDLGKEAAMLRVRELLALPLVPESLSALREQELVALLAKLS